MTRATPARPALRADPGPAGSDRGRHRRDRRSGHPGSRATRATPARPARRVRPVRRVPSTVRNASSPAGAGTRTITVPCQAGEVAVGGGHAFTSPTEPGDNLVKETLVVESRPNPASGTNPHRLVRRGEDHRWRQLRDHRVCALRRRDSVARKQPSTIDRPCSPWLRGRSLQAGGLGLPLRFRAGLANGHNVAAADKLLGAPLLGR